MTTTKGLQLTLPTIPFISPFISSLNRASSPPPRPSFSSPTPGPATPPPTVAFPISSNITFVPLSSIGDVVINEGVHGWRIIYYLAILIWSPAQGGAPGRPTEVKVAVAFPELLPRLAEVTKVWQGVRATLFDELEDDQSKDDDQEEGGDST